MSDKDFAKLFSFIGFLLLSVVLAGIGHWALVAGFWHGAFLWVGSIIAIVTFSGIPHMPDNGDVGTCIVGGIVALILGAVFCFLFWGAFGWIWLGALLFLYMVSSAISLR